MQAAVIGRKLPPFIKILNCIITKNLNPVFSNNLLNYLTSRTHFYVATLAERKSSGKFSLEKIDHNITGTIYNKYFSIY